MKYRSQREYSTNCETKFTDRGNKESDALDGPKGLYIQRTAMQRLRKHGPTCNNRTTGLCNPLLGNSPVNTFQHTRHAKM
jgi:hypothetical protein